MDDNFPTEGFRLIGSCPCWAYTRGSLDAQKARAINPKRFRRERMNLPANFSDYWDEAVRQAADQFLDGARGLELRPAVKAYFKKNKNGGSFWLEIQKPSEDIRLIDVELLKEILPITLRVRIWYYLSESHLPLKHIELGDVYLGNERVGCSAVQPRQSWRTQLEHEGIAVEGIEYPLRKLLFVNSSQEMSSAITEILRDLWNIASDIKAGKTTTERHFFPEELSELDAQYYEGTASQISVNKYERSKQAREICLAHYGAQCQICRIIFKEKYGDIGEGFMHVHHVIPLHSAGQSYEVDPINHLVPVCPNCHAMLHQKKPPYSVEEMKGKLRN